MFDDAKVLKIVEIAKENRKCFGILWNNVEQHVSEDFNTCIIKNK